WNATAIHRAPASGRTTRSRFRGPMTEVAPPALRDCASNAAGTTSGFYGALRGKQSRSQTPGRTQRGRFDHRLRSRYRCRPQVLDRARGDVHREREERGVEEE